MKIGNIACSQNFKDDAVRAETVLYLFIMSHLIWNGDSAVYSL